MVLHPYVQHQLDSMDYIYHNKKDIMLEDVQENGRSWKGGIGGEYD